MGTISYYSGCDPVLSGQIVRADSLVALTVRRLFKGIPGLTGLFIAAIFSSTMSTVLMLLLLYFLRQYYKTSTPPRFI